jgi:hypothetical protein
VSNLNDVRGEIAGKLTAGGVDATLDPATVPPFVLVGSPTVVAGAGIGGWSVDYPIHVVATPPGNAKALEWMLEQVELVLRALGPAPATPGLYGDTEAPAYELTYRRDVANPDC